MNCFNYILLYMLIYHQLLIIKKESGALGKIYDFSLFSGFLNYFSR